MNAETKTRSEMMTRTLQEQIEIAAIKSRKNGAWLSDRVREWAGCRHALMPCAGGITISTSESERGLDDDELEAFLAWLEE